MTPDASDGTPPKSLKETIKNWIKNEGYPLEMRVAKEFRHVEPDVVVQGEHYKDQETGKLRESDICARWLGVKRDQDQRVLGAVIVEFTIECKSGGSGWILFEEHNRHRFRFADSSVSNLVGYASPHQKSFKEAIESVVADRKPELFEGEFRVAYAITQHRKNKSDKDWAYAAVQQVLAAPRSRIEHLREYLEQGNICVYFIPVVVTDIPIFHCSLKDGGDDVVVEETQEGRLLMRDDDGQKWVTVHVVHESALPNFAKRCAEVGKAFKEAFESGSVEMENR